MSETFSQQIRDREAQLLKEAQLAELLAAAGIDPNTEANHDFHLTSEPRIPLWVKVSSGLLLLIGGGAAAESHLSEADQQNGCITVTIGDTVGESDGDHYGMQDGDVVDALWEVAELGAGNPEKRIPELQRQNTALGNSGFTVQTGDVFKVC